MKLIISATVLLLLSFFVHGQEAADILKKSYNACQSIQNGTYEMTKYMKFISGKDTTKRSIVCTFSKLQDDTLYSSAFHYKTYWNDTIPFEVMYTGKDFVTTNAADSSATIMSTLLWAAEIKSYTHNYVFYSPFTNRKSSPMPHDTDFTDGKHIFNLLGEQKVNGIPCYYLQMLQIPENDSADDIQTLRKAYRYWISKANFLPMQYDIAYDLLMHHDTMCQYEKIVLNKFEINNLEDDYMLTLNSIPAGYKIKDYIPYKAPELLPKDTFAPDWVLYTLKHKKISLSSLKGNLVLIDFFYKGCYPCMQALPALQALSEKYKSQGLRVVGIDPYDKKEDDIANFLAKRGITYTILLDGKPTADAYRVSAYPTLYLIDRSGKILHIQVGYGKGVEEELEELIKKNL